MDIESFAFAVRTTIVGMIIVFLFLGMLSLLMVVIRYLFDPQGRRSTGIAAHPVLNLNLNLIRGPRMRRIMPCHARLLLLPSAHT